MIILAFPHSHILAFSHSRILAFPHSHIPAFSHSHILTFLHSHIPAFSHSCIYFPLINVIYPLSTSGPGVMPVTLRSK